MWHRGWIQTKNEEIVQNQVLGPTRQNPRILNLESYFTENDGMRWSSIIPPRNFFICRGIQLRPLVHIFSPPKYFLWYMLPRYFSKLPTRGISICGQTCKGLLPPGVVCFRLFSHWIPSSDLYEHTVIGSIRPLVRFAKNIICQRSAVWRFSHLPSLRRGCEE